MPRTIPSRAERVLLYVTDVCVLRLYVLLSVYHASATHLSNLAACYTVFTNIDHVTHESSHDALHSLDQISGQEAPVKF